MIWFKRFLMTVGALSLLAASVLIFFMDFSQDRPHSLDEYPNARWRGGADGGQYVEVTKSEPPWYFVQIRHENGELWDSGWLEFGERNSEPLTPDNVIAFAGDGIIYLQQRRTLRPAKPRAALEHE